MLSGSALIGPNDVLPLASRAATTIRPLCRAPVFGLAHITLDARVFDDSFFTSAALHVGWRYLLEPPHDACDAWNHSDARRAALEFRIAHLGATDGVGQPLLDLPPAEQAGGWVVAAPLPAEGAGVVALPPLVFSVQDGSRLGVSDVVAAARLLQFTGTCNSSARPFLISPSTITTTGGSVAPAANPAASFSTGVANLSLLVDANGCSPGELVLVIETLDAAGEPRAWPRRYARALLFAESTHSVSSLAESTAVIQVGRSGAPTPADSCASTMLTLAGLSAHSWTTTPSSRRARA